MSEVLSLMERAITRVDDISFQVTEVTNSLDFVYEEVKRLQEENKRYKESLEHIAGTYNPAYPLENYFREFAKYALSDAEGGFVYRKEGKILPTLIVAKAVE